MKLGLWKFRCLLVCALWAPVVSAATLEKFKPLKLYNDEPNTPENPERPSIKGIKKIRKSVGGLDALLEILKADPKYQRLFRKPTLMFKSESLLKDFVSEAFPRAIFHVDGFLLALVTDPNAGWAYETLEMAEFNPLTSHWKAERITFGPHPDDLESCGSCHGTPYTPKWGSYGMWVGAVGGFFDYLSTDDQTRLKNWRDSESKRLSWVAGLYEEGKETNFNLTAQIDALQSRSLMNDLLKKKIYDRYSYLLRGIYGDCKEFSDFFPATGDYSLASHELRAKGTVSSLREATSTAIKDHFAARKANLFREHGSRSNFEELAQNFDYQHLDRLAQLRVVLEGQVSSKLDISQYALSEKPREGSYNFSQGKFGTTDFFMREFLPVFEKENPRLIPLCENLAEQSRKKLSP